MKKTLIAKQKSIYLISLCLLMVMTGSSCVSTRLYSVNIHYDAEKAVIPAHLKAGNKERLLTVAVSEFRDVRNVEDQTVIGHVTHRDGTSTYVMPKHIKPTQAVASSIRQYLLKAGYKVVRTAEVWDLKEETIPETGHEIILGGNIEEMELSCRRGLTIDLYQARLRISLVLADAKRKKILHRASVESITSLEHMTFSEERLARQINVTLGEAIQKLFEDRTIAAMLKTVTNE